LKVLRLRFIVAGLADGLSNLHNAYLVRADGETREAFVELFAADTPSIRD